ncbi:MAG: ATP-grasp domain-containing protein [Magnetococcales bacterium]|nr:ATP-grasp domain-containing protein [Magnetococcales bacterium]
MTVPSLPPTERTTVMVTGVGGRSVGHQILHALSLVTPAYRIVATDMDPFSFGLYLGDSRHLLPGARDVGYLPAVLEIIKKEGVQALIPGTEPETWVLTQHQAQLAAHGCVLIAHPHELVALCQDKLRLQHWLETHDIDTPITVTASEWPQLVRDTGFPIIGKPMTGSGGSRNVAILDSAAEVAEWLRIVGEENALFQEYVGDLDSEYTVGVLTDKEGRLVDSIVLHRKLVGISLAQTRLIRGKLYGFSTGYSQGFVVRHPRLQAALEHLACAIGARGPLNIQCRIDSDDKIKIFEVHPRFSGTTSIRADVGFNEPDLMIRNFLFDQTFGRLDYRSDVVAIRALQAIIVPRADLTQPAVGG